MLGIKKGKKKRKKETQQTIDKYRENKDYREQDG